jgi:DUF917 family protein
MPVILKQYCRQIEIGGMNGIRPLLTAITYKVPTIDGDLMGRAYPRLYIMTPYRKSFPSYSLTNKSTYRLTHSYAVFGRAATPCTQADGMGNTVTVNKAQDFHKLEKIHRKAGLELGLFSQLTIAPLTVKDIKEVGTLRTMSLAWYIGRAVYLARKEKTDIMKAIVCFYISGCSQLGSSLYLGW